MIAVARYLIVRMINKGGQYFTPTSPSGNIITGIYGLRSLFSESCQPLLMDWRRKCTISFNPKTIFPILFLCVLIDCCTISIIKIVGQDRQIVGRDLLITLLATFSAACYQTGLVFYFLVVINCLKTYTTTMTDGRRQLLERRFLILSRICCFVPIISITFSILPTISLWCPDYWYIFAIIYHIGVGTTSWLYGILSVYTVNSLINELKNHVITFPQHSDDYCIVIKRLSRARNAIGMGSFNAGLSFFLFGINDYFLTKSIYMYMIQLIICPISATFLLLSVSKISYKSNIDTIGTMTSISMKMKPLLAKLKSSTNLSIMQSTELI
jgi:hypothetical protein